MSSVLRKLSLVECSSRFSGLFERCDLTIVNGTICLDIQMASDNFVAS